jgi:hypothetical protein
MSTELERLAEALYRMWDCEPGEERKLLPTYRRLFQDAAAKLPPGTSQEQLQNLIRSRAMQIRVARKKHTTLPPNA